MGAVPRRRALEVLAIVVVASVFTLAVIPPEPSAPSELPGLNAPALPLDDAYIFIRFAQQIARGHGLEWSDGLGSSGATSMAYLVSLLPGQIGPDLASWVGWSRWVGWVTLILLGLAAVRLFRSLGLAESLPLVGGMTLVLCGPVGWGAVAGMESALNAAAILLATALWTDLLLESDSANSRQVAGAVLMTGLLPLFRPENALLSVLGFAAALGVTAFRSRRLLALWMLLPGGLLALLNLGLTGNPKPAGALAKSITEFAFLDPGTVWALYGFNLSQKVLPAYTGQSGQVLWPPVGWIALVTAVVVALLFASKRLRPAGGESFPLLGRLIVPTAAWWVLLLAAPLSAMVDWQYMRHHHAGLALAWVLAFAAAAGALERLRRRVELAPSVRWVTLTVPALLLIGLPVWRAGYAAGVADLLRRHGPAAEWLAAEAPDSVVLLNDAGYLAVRRDGAMVDIIGLGTPALARPYRHGPGASIEALARLTVLPDVAAVNLDVFHLEPLLGRSLAPEPSRPTDTRLATVRRELLQRTVLEARGIDFAYLPSEEAAGVSWDPSPPSLEPSRLVGVEVEGSESLQGCRPLRGRVEWAMASGVSGGSLLVVAPEGASAELLVRDGDGNETGRAIVPAGGSRRLEVRVADPGTRAGLERISPGFPCLESLAFGRE